jgi:hypothetical protein
MLRDFSDFQNSFNVPGFGLMTLASSRHLQMAQFGYLRNGVDVRAPESRRLSRRRCMFRSRFWSTTACLADPVDESDLINRREMQEESKRCAAAGELMSHEIKRIGTIR